VSGRQLTLAATVIGSSLAFIDATVVIVALPTIERDLELGLSGQQWVFLSYSLALAALYLVGGAVGDRRGRRETFVAGVAGFAVASLLAGIAPNAELLITARALQGVAGAFLTVNSLALLREVYGAEAGRAIGLWTAFTSVATIAGPPAGGALVEWVSWRWIFFINMPLAALAVVLALAGRSPEREQHRIGRLDLPGAALAALGFGSLTYGMVEGAEDGFADYWWAFVVAAVSLAAFVVVERRARDPMLPFELFRRRNFTAANLETFLVYAALSGNFVFVILYLQFLGFSPFEAGLLNIPTSLIMIALAARFGALADRSGPRLFLTGGPALVGTGTLLFVLVDQKSDFWTAGVAGLVLFALGLAMLVAPITATALSSAPSEFAGIASGVNSTVSRLGGLLAVAVVGLVIAVVFERSAGETSAVPLAKDQADPELRDASIDAFRAGMLLVAGLAFAGAAVGAVGISNEQADRDAVTAPAES
jgi:EmrB/QacA subfamily drug resistance transporter